MSIRIRHRAGKREHRSVLAGALGLALTVSVLGASPAFAASAPRDASSIVASPSAPNASGNPAPDPSSTQGDNENLIKILPASGTTAAQQAAMATAAAQAKATGKSVLVTALTDELTQVLAQPDGRFTADTNVTPVRTKQGGTWVPIDTTLHRNLDGSLSPNATAYGTVRFSSGGSAPLATTSSGSVSYAVSWPGHLPTPRVSGSSAIYPDVLPGVDLQVQATDTGGFSDTLIVKTTAAAHNPALRKLTLATRLTGGQVDRSLAKNGISVTSGTRVLQSASPMMWDSNTDLAATNPKAARAHVQLAPDPSNAGHPGLAAHLAPVATTVTATTLTLTPDPALLTGAHTVLPLYIDPTIDWNPITGGTPDYVDREQGSPCNGNSLWDKAPLLGNTGEHAIGIGDNLWSSCLGLMDPYFQWKLPAAIHGGDIQNATVKVTRNFSSSCSSSASATLHWSGGINSGTSWANPKPADLGHTVTHSWPTQSGLNCSGGDIAEGFDFTYPVSSNTNAPQITAELEADGDPHSCLSGGSCWYGNIQPNPTLQITYNIRATTPTNMAAVTGSDNVGCATAAPYPYMGKTLKTNTPVLQAQVHDPDGGHVQATFQYWIDGTSTTFTGLSTDALPNGATATYSLPSSFVTPLTNGQTVDWKVQDSDGGPESAWSATCHFTAEPTGPEAPAIADNPAGNPDYPNTSAGGGVGKAAGTPSTFTLSGAAGGASATSFVYGLDQQPPPSNPLASQIAMPVGTAASSPTHRWSLSGNGTDSVGSSTVTLAAGAGWVNNDPNRQNVMTSTNATNSYASAGGPLLNTTASYSVSAWVKLTSTSNGDAVAVSQAGTNIGAFFLGYDANKTGWCFYGYNGDVLPSGLNNWPGVCPTTDHPTLNVWTLLTGVYDASAKTRSLYVNGTLIGSGSDTTAFATSGALTIGDERYNATAAFNFPGQISDVQTYSRALTGTEVSAMFNTNNANVTITPPSDGPHTLWVYARDAAGDSNIGWASYPFIAAGHTNTVCASFAKCLNNTAISPDASPTQGNADSGGNSFSATDLANAGWKSGQTVTIDGATFTLPTFGSGAADNILAANQTIPLTGTGNALSLLVT
ncbi:MAG TPA: LamG domain-containing protein, partial [Pseudonocardiaceae bacterium]|nr:LamG domain-containing protein [Pseudonocardiaceae bacterium]